MISKEDIKDFEATVDKIKELLPLLEAQFETLQFIIKKTEKDNV